MSSRLSNPFQPLKALDPLSRQNDASSARREVFIWAALSMGWIVLILSALFTLIRNPDLRIAIALGFPALALFFSQQNRGMRELINLTLVPYSHIGLYRVIWLSIPFTILTLGSLRTLGKFSCPFRVWLVLLTSALYFGLAVLVARVALFPLKLRIALTTSLVLLILLATTGHPIPPSLLVPSSLPLSLADKVLLSLIPNFSPLLASLNFPATLHIFLLVPPLVTISLSSLAALLLREVWTLPPHPPSKNPHSQLAANLSPPLLALAIAIFSLTLPQTAVPVLALLFSILPLALLSVALAFSQIPTPTLPARFHTPVFRFLFALTPRSPSQFWKPLVLAFPSLACASLASPQALQFACHFAIPSLASACACLFILRKSPLGKSVIASIPVLLLVYTPSLLNWSLLPTLSFLAGAPLTLLAVNFLAPHVELRLASLKKSSNPAQALTLRDFADCVPPAIVAIWRQTLASPLPFSGLILFLAASFYPMLSQTNPQSPTSLLPFLILAALIQPMRVFLTTSQLFTNSGVLVTCGISRANSLLSAWAAINLQTLFALALLLPLWATLSFCFGAPSQDWGYLMISIAMLSLGLTAMASLSTQFTSLTSKILLFTTIPAILYPVFLPGREPYTPYPAFWLTMLAISLLALATAAQIASPGSSLLRKFRRCAGLLSPVLLLLFIYLLPPVLPSSSPAHSVHELPYIYLLFFIATAVSAYPLVDLALESAAQRLPSRLSYFSPSSLFLPASLALPSSFILSLAVTGLNALIISSLVPAPVLHPSPLPIMFLFTAIFAIAAAIAAPKPCVPSPDPGSVFVRIILVFWGSLPVLATLALGIFFISEDKFLSHNLLLSLLALATVTTAFLLSCRILPSPDLARALHKFSNDHQTQKSP